MKLKNYYKKQLILIFAPYNFLIFIDTQLHEPKITEKTISEFFGDGVLVFSGEILGSFLLIPPTPHSRSELVSDWLKFTCVWVKTLRHWFFRISIMVGGELNQWGVGLTEKMQILIIQRSSIHKR